MGVSLSLAEDQPTSKDGKPYRHYSEKCKLFLQTPQSKRKTGAPNTKKLRAKTERCPQKGLEPDGCWDIYERDEAERLARRAAGTRSTKAAKQPAKAQGGKAASIASKAAKARKPAKKEDVVSTPAAEKKEETAAASA